MQKTVEQNDDNNESCRFLVIYITLSGEAILTGAVMFVSSSWFNSTLLFKFHIGPFSQNHWKRKA